MATIFRTHGPAAEISMPMTLEGFQEIVGGYIEFVHFRDGSALCVNENGLLISLAPNEQASALCKMKGRPESIVGDVLFLSKKEMRQLVEEAVV